MSPRRQVRTQKCSEADAGRRLRNARAFAEVAELVAQEGAAPEYRSVAASLAVLAGIAASDVACCRALGVRARGSNHAEALTLVEQVEPGGGDAARALGRLLSLKDQAQYDFISVGGADLRAALRQAQALVKFGEDSLAG